MAIDRVIFQWDGTPAKRILTAEMTMLLLFWIESRKVMALDLIYRITLLRAELPGGQAGSIVQPLSLVVGKFRDKVPAPCQIIQLKSLEMNW